MKKLTQSSATTAYSSTLNNLRMPIMCIAMHISLIWSCSKLPPASRKSTFSFPIWAVLRHSFPGHWNGAAFWTRLFHEDCPELHLQGGILTAGSSTLCSRTEMTSLNILKPSRRVHMVHLTSSAWERHLATWGCYRTKTSFFSLCFFHNIMPHQLMLYQKLQKKDIDAVFIKRALESFTSSVQTIR